MSGPSLEEARTMIEEAQKRGLEIGKALSVAVVDYGGFVVALERMDGAAPLTPNIALAKAYSAAVMQRPSGALKGWSNGDPVFFSQVARMGHQPIVATLGGYTLKRGETVVGGVGVSGGFGEEDEAIARAVLEAAGFSTDFPGYAPASPAK